ncbi:MULTISPECIES: hypothetical protein [unclassified Chryseobacterium]|uniref:hypothetical protein n=1 Tax=unclassified Chryseobacterium TaxID=2593645 RepID=UPI00115B1B84|nr:hypothetical protein [Chryseobacterium sp. ON_d1]
MARINNIAHQEKYSSASLDQAIRVSVLHFYADQQHKVVRDGLKLDFLNYSKLSETANELVVDSDFACKEMMSMSSMSLAFGACCADNK